MAIDVDAILRKQAARGDANAAAMLAHRARQRQARADGRDPDAEALARMRTRLKTGTKGED